MKELKPVIYKITNKVNGKIYVGGAEYGIEQRWNRHLTKVNQGSTAPLHTAIREYGKDNFIIEPIQECKDLDELNNRECYWIAQLHATNTEIGYNIRSGGGIKNHSDITKQKISKIHKGKISEARIPILQYDCEGNFLKEYPSITEAAKDNKYPNSKIIRGLEQKVSRPTNTNPYMWFYKPEGDIKLYIDPKEYYKDLNFKIIQSDKFIKTRKKYETADGDMSKISVAVAQYDLNNNLIKKYYSIAEASRSTGVSARTIRNFLLDPNYFSKLRKTNKTKFIWKQCDKNDPDIQITKQDIINKVAKKNSRIIRAIDPKTGSIIKEYNTIKEFEKAEHADRRTMLQYANTDIIWKNYYWEVEN